MTATSPPAGGTFTLPTPLILVVDFNEPISDDPNPDLSVGTDDLTLNVGTVTGAFKSGPNQATYVLSGITNEGTLNVTLGAGKLADAFGNPNAAFTASYTLDRGTTAFPVPLVAVSPRGSLVYQGSITGTVGFIGDTDSYSLSLDAGQQLTVLVDPAATLRPSVLVIGPLGTIVGTATATGNGLDALSLNGLITTAGTYTIVVSGAAGTTGAYTLTANANAAHELKAHNGPSNNTTAQNLDPAFITLGPTQSRAAVVGQLDGATLNIDLYSFNLPADGRVSLALEDLVGTAAEVELRNASGALIASGLVGPTNSDRVLNNVALAAGTYSVRIRPTASSTSSYTLVVIRNGMFDAEPNDPAGSARDITRPAACSAWSRPPRRAMTTSRRGTSVGCRG